MSLSAFTRFLSRFGNAKQAPGNVSYSQCGEDLIVSFLLIDVLGIARPSYLDIGTHHPVEMNNTYSFYLRSCHGVCVEPDPALFDIIQTTRPRDVCLNAGVGTGRETRGRMYVFCNKLFNTLSETVGRDMQGLGEELIEIVEVDLLSINVLMKRYFDPWPNFVSIDAEGMDYDILKSIDFATFRPEALCVETLTSTDWRKTTHISDYMNALGYTVYADTNINTIFVESTVWERRLQARRATRPTGR